MSLNGLDDDAVIQAYQTALTEAGGWFLLKYANRDTVELLGRGGGGVTEARKVVEEYEEKSPLYGLLQYRRKKFILKYVPDGTSRLLQVRLAVQFQSILDTFAPHDTVFSFVTASELTESALGLSTILQTSSATSSKASSSSSLRQQRLNEITEDSEEVAIAGTVEPALMSSPLEDPPNDENAALDRLPPSAAKAKELLAKRKQERDLAMTETSDCLSVSIAESPHVIPEQSHKSEPSQTKASPLIIDKDLPAPPPEEYVASPVSLSQSNSVAIRPSLDFSIPQPESDSDDDFRRPVRKENPQIRYSAHLSAAESSSISKWSDDVMASTSKPKQKRSRTTGELMRPKTSGTGDEVTASRRANLPTTVRFSKRSSAQSSRPGSQQSTRSVPGRLVPTNDLAPPVPSGVLSGMHARGPSQGRPATSQTSSFSNENPGITPEKMRLMKALQMRKRNQLLMQKANTGPSPVSDPRISTDSSQSAHSESSIANVISSSSGSASRETATQALEVTSIRGSQTTSPHSILTGSDNHSTKPSSLSDNSPKNDSRTSLSSETGSSTTPKADLEKEQNANADVAAGQKKPEGLMIEYSERNPKDSVLNVVSDGDPQTSRPLTYHCATADFLADIEEEDRSRPLSVAKNTEAQIPPQAISSTKQTKKRYQFEGTIQIPPSNISPSADSDDESFTEEIQNATVHEAKPVSVNRTPATPVLSKSSSRSNTLDINSEPKSTTSDRSFTNTGFKSRSPSNDSQMSTPNRRRTASRAGSTRSLSTALPQWPPPPTEPVPAMPRQRPVIGATISKRVKTFEGLSQRDASLPVPPPKDTASRSSSLSNMLKRASFLGHLHSDKTPEKTGSKTTPSPSPSPLRSEFESTETELPARPWVQRPESSSAEVYSPTHKGETVSVTARIVRDPVKPKSAHGTSDTTPIMHMSPLIVEHETFPSTDLRPPLPRDPTTLSMDSLNTSMSPSERRRFSFSSHKSNGSKLSPVENKSHRLSMTSHKKAPKPPSDSSSIVEEKRQSRTSRMLKRLSGLGKSKRDSAIASPTREQPQPNIIEESTVPESEAELGLDSSAIRQVVDVGEVNVQFADTLLWKRRFLRVDDQGFLIFAPPANDLSTRGKSRKVHLEEFYRPILPDHETEEMAWSILLDMKNGGTVQCACENKKAQMDVLKMLLDAHNAYHHLYC